MADDGSAFEALRDFVFYFLIEQDKKLDVNTLPATVKRDLDNFAYYMRKPYVGVEIRNRTYHLKEYKTCFVANEAVKWISNFLKIETEIAVKIGVLMQQANHIAHVTGDHIFTNKYLFFRFVKPKKVLIIGGGYAGSKLTKELQGSFEVALIDKKPNFESILSFPQLTTNPQLLPQISVPHVKYLDQGQLIVGEVSELVPPDQYDYDAEKNPSNRGHVKLKTGESYFYDYLVVATGSTTVAPFPIEGKHNCIVNPYQSESIVQAYDKLQSAKRIVIVGSGPVGVEVAGEVAAKFPSQEVILISQRTLLERLAPTALKNVYQTLSKYKNLQIKLGKRVASITNNLVRIQNVADVDENTEWDGNELLFTVVKNEDTIQADIIFLSVGFKPNTTMFEAHMADSLDKFLAVKVNNRFQVMKNEAKQTYYDNIFAIGDITNVREEKLAQAAEKHAEVLSDIIAQLETSASKIPQYTPPSGRIMIISMGPNKAIFINGKKILFDGAVAAKIKGITEAYVVRKAAAK